MKINHNMPAVIANNKLLSSEDKLTQSLERLSSGLKINHAKDNPAGMAIANKMDSQIRGLDRASDNAQDGESVIETAEGALSEVTDIIQRMRELAIQGSNGTYVDEDREAMQLEVDSLAEEINRIASDTEFNTKTLLDGSFEQRAYADNTGVSMKTFSDTVPVQEYGITINSDARQAVFVADVSDAAQTDITAAQAGAITINGESISIEEGDDAATVYEKIRSCAEKVDVTLISVSSVPAAVTSTDSEYAGYTPEAFAYGNSLIFISEDYGSDAELSISCDNTDLAAALGLTVGETNVSGIDVDAELTSVAGSYIGYSSTASLTTSGKNITVTDSNGFSMTVEADAGVTGTQFTDSTATVAGTITPTASEDIILDVKDIGTLTIQIGANENQTMEIRIPDMSLEGLDLDNLNYLSDQGLGKAITALDSALEKVSLSRARLGAYQNRLEHAVNSLDTTSLNMTSALSRIEDVDMAEEMSTYTQLNVLTQAATSVLAQANEQPQQVLQLLQ